MLLHRQEDNILRSSNNNNPTPPLPPLGLPTAGVPTAASAPVSARGGSYSVFTQQAAQGLASLGAPPEHHGDFSSVGGVEALLDEMHGFAEEEHVHPYDAERLTPIEEENEHANGVVMNNERVLAAFMDLRKGKDKGSALFVGSCKTFRGWRFPSEHGGTKKQTNKEATRAINESYQEAEKQMTDLLSDTLHYEFASLGFCF